MTEDSIVVEYEGIYPIYIHVPDGIKAVFILCNKYS